VDFRSLVFSKYHDNGESPSRVRELFYGTAPWLIYDFFRDQVGTAPHAVNIFPVGVADNMRERYTYCFVLNKLPIRIREFAVPAVVSEEAVKALYVRILLLLMHPLLCTTLINV